MQRLGDARQDRALGLGQGGGGLRVEAWMPCAGRARVRTAREGSGWCVWGGAGVGVG